MHSKQSRIGETHLRVSGANGYTVVFNLHLGRRETGEFKGRNGIDLPRLDVEQRRGLTIKEHADTGDFQRRLSIGARLVSNALFRPDSKSRQADELARSHRIDSERSEERGGVEHIGR